MANNFVSFDCAQYYPCTGPISPSDPCQGVTPDFMPNIDPNSYVYNSGNGTIDFTLCIVSKCCPQDSIGYTESMTNNFFNLFILEDVLGYPIDLLAFGVSIEIVNPAGGNITLNGCTTFRIHGLYDLFVDTQVDPITASALTNMRLTLTSCGVTRRVLVNALPALTSLISESPELALRIAFSYICDAQNAYYGLNGFYANNLNDLNLPFNNPDNFWLYEISNYFNAGANLPGSYAVHRAIPLWGSPGVDPEAKIENTVSWVSGTIGDLTAHCEPCAGEINVPTTTPPDYTVEPPATNVDCTLAIDVSFAGIAEVMYWSEGSTGSGLPAGACAGNPDEDVWFSFVANDYIHKIYITPSVGYDPVVEVYDGLCPVISEIACANTNLTGQSEELYVYDLVPGNTYYVRVYHADVGAGTGTFNLVQVPPFQINLAFDGLSNITECYDY